MANFPSSPISEGVLLGYISPIAASRVKSIVQCPEFSDLHAVVPEQLQSLVKNVEILPGVSTQEASERFALAESFKPLQVATTGDNSLMVEFGVAAMPNIFLYQCAQRMRDGSFRYFYFLERTTGIDSKEVLAIDPETFEVTPIKNKFFFYKYRNECFREGVEN